MLLLRKKPMTGMDIIREVEKLSMGIWRPSPGTIYPLLRALEKDGLVISEKIDGRKVYKLSTRGMEIAKEFSIFMPARDIDDVVTILEAYINYLEDYVGEGGTLSKDLKLRLQNIAETLARISGEK